MKFYNFFAFFVMFWIFFVGISIAQTTFNVGVSPSLINLGNLERGTTNIVKFYVVTESDKPLLVSLESENGRLEFFDISYKNLIYNYSEEGTSSWVKFLSNPVELKPQNSTYETIKGWREVNFLLEIPKNAEPGYHVVRIRPSPSVPTGTGGGVGSRLVAITSINIIFNIPGDAKRDGLILDTVAGNFLSNNLDIDTYFQNTGTTTITAKATQKIYDKDGNFITEIESTKEYVKPKEVRVLISSLPLNGISLGDYQVFNTVSYTTDSAYKNSTISITPELLVAKPKAEEFPVWIFIVIIIIIALIIYRWVH